MATKKNEPVIKESLMTRLKNLEKTAKEDIRKAQVHLDKKDLSGAMKAMEKALQNFDKQMKKYADLSSDAPNEGQVRYELKQQRERMSTLLHGWHKESMHAVVKKFIDNHSLSSIEGLKEPHLNALVKALKTTSNDFIEGKINLEIYKTKCHQALDRSKEHFKLTREPNTILEHISNTIRSMFNVLDRMVTWTTGAKKSMDETYTPGAKTLTGRDHFFNRPETSLGKEIREFSDALDKMKDLGPTHGAQPGK